MNSSPGEIDRVESPSASEGWLAHTNEVFESLLERSADAIWLHEVSDTGSAVLVDCNQAAVDLIGARSKQQLLHTTPEELSPPVQLDGTSSAQKSAEILNAVLREKTYRFEWALRRLDGKVIPTEVSVTAVMMGGKRIHVAISREISERKKAERDLLELNQSLERRVTERTAELTTSEARLRALVEHAPEAIVVFDGVTGRFLFGNDHACRLYAVPMEKLAELTPLDVSPEFQPSGQRSSELAREKMDEALAGGMPVFEWIHQQPNGRLIPTEVRLLRLPSEGENLIRASIIDSTDRKRAERALRESEEKFRALFEATSNGVVLMDTEKLLDVNPAAVRILGRQSAHEMVGKHPSAFSPPMQPNGVNSEVMAGRYIEECIAKGSVRLEWICASPEGREIPLEVLLTRIEWSGRQVIQACITDITERKQAERALRQANTDLHREIEQRTRAEESLKERVRMSTFNAEVAVSLNAGVELQPMLQRCCELMVQHLDVAFARIWLLNPATQTLELQSSAGCYTHLHGPHSRVKVGQFKIGSIAQNKLPVLTNSVQSDPRVSDHEWATREGMVAFAGYPLMIEDRVLGVLAMFARHSLSDDLLNTLASVADSLSLGIERKRAQMAHTESEARFSAAFQASTVCMTISRMDDRKFLLANEAFLKWTGYRLDEVIGRDSLDLGMWADPAERERLWEEVRRTRSVRERECRMRNRHGKPFIMLVSCDAIEIQGATHLLTVGLDITERKRAEAALAESEARFSAAFNFSPIMTGITRASDGRFVLVNDAALNWIGCSSKEVLGHTSVELGLWEDPSDRNRFWEHLQMSGSTQPWECRLKNRQGKPSTMLASGVKIEISGEDHLLVMMVDISERKKAEAELRASEARLRESEARFSAAFRASPISIVIYRMDNGRSVLANEAFLKWAGYRLEEVQGHNSLELGIWEDPAERDSLWQELRRTNSVHERECRMRNRHGTPFIMLISADVIKIDGEPHVLAVGLDITERQRAQAALAESEARFSAAFQASPALIGVVRLSDGKYVLVNDAHVNWLGYPREEILGRKCVDLGMWENPVDREALLKEMGAHGSVRNRECRWQNRHGQKFTVLLSAETISLNDSPHMLLTALDITQRKRAEEELKGSEARLRESETRFSVAFQASPVFISIMRVSDEKYVLANDALVNWAGYRRDEVLGRTSGELGMWGDPAERQAVWRDLRTIGSIRQRECRWRNRRGELFTILLSVETITLDNQAHVLSMALDISQRKRVEEELRASEALLRESESRFSVAFEASPMFINILDLNHGKYVWANDAFVNRLGYSREHVLGRPSTEFELWADPAERESAWKTMRIVGSIRQKECRWLTRSGEPITILLSAEIINFNNTPHVLSLALDITLRKRAEEELLKALDREKELSQLKSNFVSMVSHEFRTPLGIIQSSAELLRDFYQKMQQEEREEQLDSISGNTRRMAGMMEEILVLSRLDAGKLQCKPAPLDLPGFCRRLVDEVLSATNRRCGIELFLKSGLHEARADGGLLSHIFTNILTNAVKYSEPGATVHFMLQRDGLDLVGTVRDRGLGISEQDQEKLFTAFHRGANVGTRPGTGLGLVLVKRCADLHGGKVKITSKPGEGTTVVVRLPIFSNEKNTGD